MHIHDTKLTKYLKSVVLMQERVCDVRTVSIMVRNKMQNVGKIINYIYFMYSTIRILRDRLYSATKESKNLIKTSSILKMRACTYQLYNREA